MYTTNYTMRYNNKNQRCTNKIGNYGRRTILLLTNQQGFSTVYTVRYAWGLGRNNFFGIENKEENINNLMTNGRKPLPGLAKEVSWVFLSGHGKRGELKILLGLSKWGDHWCFFSTPERLHSCLVSSGDLAFYLAFSSLWVCKNA